MIINRERLSVTNLSSEEITLPTFRLNAPVVIRAKWLFVMMQNLLYLSNLIGATTCRYARIIMPQFYQ